MTLPPDAEKVRAKFYVFKKDIQTIDSVFAAMKSGKALAGEQMQLTKTQWVREVLHRAVQKELVPYQARITAAGQSSENSQ